nr:hypothetical protein [Tanacetum cinerariifolium]
MSTPSFAKTYNLIAYLEKPTESEGYAQIINFLNRSPIKYALTASPTIYTSCIKQFWTTAKVKTINDEVRIQALVDGKRVNVKESSIRRTLWLDDAEGTSCLTYIEIVEGLTKIGAKTISWNEFSSTMASAIICLATNQKINFSRYILLSLVKNIEAGVPFFMFPSGEDSLKLKEVMDLCTNLSNKVLEFESKVIDIKSTYQERIKKLEGRVERLEEENRVFKELKSVHSTYDDDEPIIEKEKSSKQERKIADIDADVEINLEKAQAKAYNLDLDHQEKVLSMMDVNKEEPADVEEVLEVVKAAKLTTEVVTTAGATKVSVSIKRRGVIIQEYEESTTTATVQPKVQAKDKEKAILIEESNPLKKQAQIELDEKVARQLEAELNADINWNDWKPLTQAQARRNMIVYLKNMDGFKMDYFKGMTYNEIRPLFEKHYNFNQTFLDEVNEGVKVSETEVRQEKDVKVESSKREGESLEQDITKKQNMEEETEELKKHLQIVIDDDDDVYTDATPLASKIPIVDYNIHTKRKRPYFKIIRADGNHMLFISLSTMLKNFDREDLVSFWIIVRDKFEKTKPKNYSDDYLLNTLKLMFENPNVEASIFLLVERMYPLTHFTLEQMLNNVRLQVEDENEMSLELLRLVRRQLNEGLTIILNRLERSIHIKGSTLVFTGYGVLNFFPLWSLQDRYDCEPLLRFSLMMVVVVITVASGHIVLEIHICQEGSHPSASIVRSTKNQLDPQSASHLGTLASQPRTSTAAGRFGAC